jgi:hypothetical protein
VRLGVCMCRHDALGRAIWLASLVVFSRHAHSLSLSRSLSLALSLSLSLSLTSSPHQTAGILRAWFASRIALAWNRSTVKRKRIRRVSSVEKRPNASAVCTPNISQNLPQSDWHALSTLLSDVSMSIERASAAG